MATLLEWFSEGKSNDTLLDNEAIPTDGNDTVTGTFKAQHTGNSRVRMNDAGGHRTSGAQLEIDQAVGQWCILEWLPASSQSQMSLRFYRKIDNPQGIYEAHMFRMSTGGALHYEYIGGTDLGANAGKHRYASTTDSSWTTNTYDNGDGWHRIEMQIDTVNGTWDIRQWLDPEDTGTPDDELNLSMPSGTNVDYIYFGARSSTLSPDHRFTDILITDTLEWLGPVSTGGDVELDGDITGSTAVAGDINTIATISGDIAGSSALAGNPSIQGTVLFDGDVTGSTAVSGTLNVEHAISGDIVGSTLTEGNFFTSPPSTDLEYAADWENDANARLDDPSARRKLDVYYPTGTKPPNGWPVVFWVHGGFFRQGDKTNVLNTSSNSAAYAMLEELLDRGIAVVTPNYRYVASTPNGESATITQHPDQIDDIQLAISYCHANQVDMDLDMSQFVLSGHSAGGYLAIMAGLLATAGDVSAMDYWQHFPTEQLTTYDMRASTRYTGGSYTPDLHVPLGVAAWEAPIDLHWNTYRESVAGVGWVLDDTLRGYVGDDSYADEGFSRVSASKIDDAAIAYTDGGSNYITSNAPPGWYCACVGNTWTTSFVQTLDDGVSYTGGNGYAMQQEYITNDVPFEDWLADGADHDDINGYRSTEFADWVEHLIELNLSGDIAGSTTVAGTLTVTTTREIDGDIAGSTAVAGDLNVEASVTGDIAGSTVVAGALNNDPAIAGDVNGSTTVAGNLSVEVAIAGDITGSTIVAGDLSNDPVISGDIAGSTTVAGTLSTEATISGDIVGSTVVAGTLNVEAVLSGDITGSTAVAGSLNPDLSLGGDIAGSTAVAGDMNMTATISGDIAGGTATSGNPSTQGIALFQGDITGSTAVAGDLNAVYLLDGAVTGTTTVSGIISTEADITISGDIAGSTTVAGTLSVDPAIGGDIAGSTTVAGTLNVEAVVSGDITGSTTVTGTPTTVSVAQVSGDIVGSTVVAGSLNVEASIGGDVAGDTDVAGVIVLELALGDGDITGTTTVTGDLYVEAAGIAELDGSITGGTTLVGVLNVDPALSGDIVGATVAAGIFTRIAQSPFSLLTAGGLVDLELVGFMEGGEFTPLLWGTDIESLQ